MTERDAQLNSAWVGIEQTLFRHLGPSKLNFMVAVRALDDPKPEDVQYISSLVLDAVRAGGYVSRNLQIRRASRAKFGSERSLRNTR